MAKVKRLKSLPVKLKSLPVKFALQRRECGGDYKSQHVQIPVYRMRFVKCMSSIVVHVDGVLASLGLSST